MKLTLDEITPERILELTNGVEEQRLTALIRANVVALADEFQAAKQHATELQTLCQIRALKMCHLGYNKSELSDVFNVPLTTINKWLKAPIEVGGSW